MSYFRVEPVASPELLSSGSEISSIDLTDNSPRNDQAAVRMELSQRRHEVYRQQTAAAVKIQRWFRHIKSQSRQTGRLSSRITSMSEDEETEGEDIYTSEPNYSNTSPSIQYQSSFDKFVEEQYLITLVMVNEKSISSLTEDQQEAVRKLRAEIKGPPPEKIQAFQEARRRHGYNKSEKQPTAPVGGCSAEGECRRGKKCAKMMNTIRPGDNDPKTVLRKHDLLVGHPMGFKPTVNNAHEVTDCVVERNNHQKLKVPQFGKHTDCHTENQQLFGTRQFAQEHHKAHVQEDVPPKRQHCSDVNNGKKVTMPTERRMDKHRSGYGKVQGASTGKSLNTTGKSLNTTGNSLNTTGNSLNTTGNSLNTTGNSLNTTGNRLHTKNAYGPDSSAARLTYDKVTLQPCTFKKKSKLTAHSNLHNQRMQNLVAEQETRSTVRELNRLEKFPGKTAHRPQGPSQLSFSSHKPSYLQQTEMRSFIAVEREHPNHTVRKHYSQAWDKQRTVPNSLSPLYSKQNEVEIQAANKKPTSLQTKAGYLQQLNEPRRPTIRALQTPVYRPSPQKPAGSYLLRHLKGGVRAGPAKHKRIGKSDLANYSTLSTPGLGYSYCATRWPHPLAPPTGPTRRQAPTFHMHGGIPTHLQSSVDLELSHASVPSKGTRLRAAAHPQPQRSLPAHSWPPQSQDLIQLKCAGFPRDYQTGHVIHTLPGVSVASGTWVTPGGDYSRGPNCRPSHAHQLPTERQPPPHSFQSHW